MAVENGVHSMYLLTAGRNRTRIPEEPGLMRRGKNGFSRIKLPRLLEALPRPSPNAQSTGHLGMVQDTVRRYESIIELMFLMSRTHSEIYRTKWDFLR